MAMHSLLYDSFVEICVYTSATLVLGSVMDTSPVDLLVPSLLSYIEIAVVLQLRFSFLA